MTNEEITELAESIEKKMEQHLDPFRLVANYTSRLSDREIRALSLCLAERADQRRESAEKPDDSQEGEEEKEEVSVVIGKVKRLELGVLVSVGGHRIFTRSLDNCLIGAGDRIEIMFDRIGVAQDTSGVNVEQGPLIWGIALSVEKE